MINDFIKSKVIPASFCIYSKSRLNRQISNFRKLYSNFKIKLVEFENNTKLSYTIFEKNNKYPYMICFMGNNFIYEQYLQRFYQEFKFWKVNMVLFNYRGIGSSQGNINSIDDLIEDGKNIVEMISQKFPQNIIILRGYSLGGAIATCAIEPYLNNDRFYLINERSFSSTLEVGKSWYGNILGPIVAWLLNKYGWYIKPFEIFNKLESKRKLCLCLGEKEDRIIRHKASLYYALGNKDRENIYILHNQIHKCSHNSNIFDIYSRDKISGATIIAKFINSINQ